MRRNVRWSPVLLVLVALLATLVAPSTAAAAAKISGRVTGVNDTLVLGPGATIASNWNGTFDFPLQALSKGGATYNLAARTIGAWSAAITADACSGTLAWNGIADRGDGSVTLTRRADGSLTYFVSFAWLRSTLVDGVLNCPDDPPTVPYSMGASAPVVISERATPKLPAQGSGPIGSRLYGGPPMQATWTLSAPSS